MREQGINYPNSGEKLSHPEKLSKIAMCAINRPP